MVRMRARRKYLAATAVLAVLALGGGTVYALSGLGSREITQSSVGVKGTSETGDFFAVELTIGDFDGDGYDDVVSATPYENLGTKADAGQVQVLYGGSSGLTTSRDRVLHQGKPGVVGRSFPDDLFGSAVAAADFNGDGFDDLAVGVAGKDIGGITDAGWVAILYGDEDGLSGRGSKRFGQDSAGVEGDPQMHGSFGHSVVGADFNNDGFDDVAVGAPGDPTPGAARGGTVTVLYGSVTGISGEGSLLLHQGIEGVADEAEEGDVFGWAVGAGDFDGNGYVDLAVGAPGESINELPGAGAVHVFHGSDVGIVADGSLMVTEDTLGVAGIPEVQDRLGNTLDAGDFDDDGFEDLAIGVPGEARGSKISSGVVQVLRGSALGVTGVEATRISQASSGVPDKPEAGDEFGYRVAVGDFNGNGRDDLAVGAPGETINSLTGAGTAHVLFGATSGIRGRNSEQWYPGLDRLAGSLEANAGVGRALAAGDIDGDGRDDLVIGVPGRTARSKSAAGSFIVLYG